jgi:heme/copper-type cytochrome/quinol oxidase subunit 2
MTFFDWSEDDGKNQVSSYLWIYVVITTLFTAMTVGMWYYFVIHRRSARKPVDEENAATDPPAHGRETTWQIVWSRMRRFDKHRLVEGLW